MSTKADQKKRGTLSKAAPAQWALKFGLDYRTHFASSRARTTARLLLADILAALPPSARRHGPQLAYLQKARRARNPSQAQYAAVVAADHLSTLFESLSYWTPKEANRVLEALRARWHLMSKRGRFNLQFDHVIRWVEEHQGDSADRDDAVCECIAVDTPSEVRIERRITQRGAQKRVFQGTWTVADDPTEIVLKKLKNPAILEGEQRPHPLAMRHPNIIEVYTLPNQAREPEVFLVERRVEVFDETRLPKGRTEVSQMLVDIGRALAFLGDHGLVHGDVKFDNLGYTEGHFLLLDFGICRSAGEYARLGNPAGSLQTRAPELLLGAPNSAASDVWSLAATVFRALTGRYPLYFGFPGPPSNDKGLSAERLEKMRKRTSRYEDQLAPLEKIDDRRLRDLVGDALLFDPTKRLTAHDLVSEALTHLPALIGEQAGPRFAPDAELNELKRHVSLREKDLRLLSKQSIRELSAHLQVIQRGLTAQRHYRNEARRLGNLYANLCTDVEQGRVVLSKSDLAEARILAERLPQDIAPEDREAQVTLDRLRNGLAAVSEAENGEADDLEDLLRRSVKSAAVNRYDGGTIGAVAEEFLWSRSLKRA